MPLGIIAICANRKKYLYCSSEINYLSMIKSFKHKGLEKFFLTENEAGIQPKHARKLNLLLDALNTARTVEALNVPGWNLYALKGDLENLWSLKVNANWRLTFMFEDGDVFILDYRDYH